MKEAELKPFLRSNDPVRNGHTEEPNTPMNST